MGADRDESSQYNAKTEHQNCDSFAHCFPESFRR
jgi:hypothetical protein